MKDGIKIQEQDKVYVRYIVNDVKRSVEFYTHYLGFKVEMQPPSNGFAMLSIGNLYLLMNPKGQGGAGQTLSDGSIPKPGGWNRMQLRVENLEQKFRELESSDVSLRSGMIRGNGGVQILLEDPSGNLIELFEAYKETGD